MARSHNDRTASEIRAQRCIEDNPELFAKQIRGEAFTVEESEAITTCALPTAEEIQANHIAGWTMLGIFAPIFIGLIAYLFSLLWKDNKEMKEADRR